MTAASVQTGTRIRYSRAAAAEQLSISTATLDRLRVDGKITARRDGGKVFFDHAELVSYARSCPAEEA